MNNRLLLFLLILTVWEPSERCRAQTTPPQSIRVVMDDNYPPYAFKNGEGTLQGILPDQWRLWSKKTGIKVDITALDWDDVLRRMKAGEFDVIDTIFKTPDRMRWLDFSKPYAQLKVSIFFDREISGIHDVASIRGFAVAAKRGDNAVDLLQQQGVKQLVLFNSYRDVISAAQQGKVNVFVVDQPPALYFLHQFGVRNQYKMSRPINVGEFHRAVIKGNDRLLHLVESGFAQMTPKEIKQIARKWEGASVLKNPLFLTYLAGVVAILLLLILLLLIWTRTLRQVVAQRTVQLKQANAQLRSSNEQYRALFDNAAEGILVADAATRRFEFANPMIERMLGYPAGELIGKGIEDIHPPEAIPLVTTEFEAQCRGGKTLAPEVPCRRKDGRIIHVDIHAAPVPFNGKLCSMGLFTDITQRKQAEEALLAKNEEMDRFVYAVSHDLKAPLITFQTYLAFLEQDLHQPDEATIQRDIAFMQSAAVRMKSLLDDLLILSRVGRVVHPAEPVTFYELGHEALRAVAGRIATQKVDIVWCGPDLKLCGDRTRLVEIWQNLIDNAVKFMGEQPHPHIELGWEASLPEICFYVRDNGMGLEPTQQNRIFDLFEKLNPTGEGTGLGLTLVKRIVELYHGRLWVESPGLGQGSCFKFTLPDALAENRQPV